MEKLTFFELDEKQKAEALQRYNGDIEQAKKGYYLLISGVIVMHCM